jgi:hypothetical protein
MFCYRIDSAHHEPVLASLLINKIELLDQKSFLFANFSFRLAARFLIVSSRFL